MPKICISNVFNIILILDESEPASEESTPQGKAKEEPKPNTPEDVFKLLHKWDDEPTDWWTITKKKKDYDEWMKPMKDGTIRRVTPYIYNTILSF